MKELLYLKDTQLKQLIERLFISYIESFADAINNGTRPIVSLRQGAEALRVAQMIIDCF